MNETLPTRVALEAPIPNEFSFLYASVRSALCFDLLRFNQSRIPSVGTQSYHETIPDYKHALQGFVDSVFTGEEYTGEFPAGTAMAPEFIRGFNTTLTSMGYSTGEQKLYLQRLFGEIEDSADGVILIQSRSFSRYF